jgi:hypothetical protein
MNIFPNYKQLFQIYEHFLLCYELFLNMDDEQF